MAPRILAGVSYWGFRRRGISRWLLNSLCRGPFRDIDRQRRLDAADADASQELSPGPIAPVPDQSLENQGLESPFSQRTRNCLGRTTYAYQDDPKKVQGHLPSDHIADRVQQNHSDELPEGLQSTPQ